MEIDRIGYGAYGPVAGVGDTQAAATARSRRDGGAAGSSGPGFVAPSDTLEISDGVRELARAHEAVSAADEVRTERVAAIKQRVEDGSYYVPAELVAARMLGLTGNDA